MYSNRFMANTIYMGLNLDIGKTSFDTIKNEYLADSHKYSLHLGECVRIYLKCSIDLTGFMLILWPRHFNRTQPTCCTVFRICIVRNAKPAIDLTDDFGEAVKLVLNAIANVISVFFAVSFLHLISSGFFLPWIYSHLMAFAVDKNGTFFGRVALWMHFFHDI